MQQVPVGYSLRLFPETPALASSRYFRIYGYPFPSTRRFFHQCLHAHS
jgi:hypothetical protein